ncbi:hypothetical protein ACMGE7_01770 [Macrococcus equi]|uniref:hypothetical protein n=1 Tax=Macrococcus equi TaxID=3395462 RepID=UPI0039BE5062
MKKIWSLVITFSLLLAIFSPLADAKRPPVPTPIPNISSKTVAQKIKSGTYSYYGVKLGNYFSVVKKKWGKPTKRSVYKSSITIPEYSYGPIGNLKVKGTARGSVSEYKVKVDHIMMSTRSNTKYEYKTVMKNFGATKDIRTSGSIRMVTWTKDNTYTIINFKKVGTKWYAYSLSNSKVGLR